MLKSNNKLNGFTFIDLFAGIGGFRIALESLGAKCVYSSEQDFYCQQVYFDNFNVLPEGDITKINENSIPHHDILCAGFPCQPFSISGKQEGFNDKRGILFFDIIRIIKCKNPRVVFLENVKNLLKHNNGKTFKIMKNILHKIGYSVFFKILNAKDYSIPQNRERLYIICFRKDLNIKFFSFPRSEPFNVTVKDILLDDSEVNDLYIDEGRKIQWLNHSDSKLLNRPKILGHIGNKPYQGNRIYDITGIAVTLTSNGGGKFSNTNGYLINGKIRKLHPRECARLMGFPESYKLCKNLRQAYKQFGNSVVVKVIKLLAEKIGLKLKRGFNNEKICSSLSYSNRIDSR